MSKWLGKYISYKYWLMGIGEGAIQSWNFRAPMTQLLQIYPYYMGITLPILPVLHVHKLLSSVLPVTPEVK